MTTERPIEVPWTVAEYDPDVVWTSCGNSSPSKDPAAIIPSATPGVCIYFASRQASVVLSTKLGAYVRAPNQLSIPDAKVIAASYGCFTISVVDEEGVEVRCYEVSP